MKKNETSVKLSVLYSEQRVVKVNYYAIVKTIVANAEQMPNLYKIVMRNGGKKRLCANNMHLVFEQEMHIGEQRHNADGTLKFKKNGEPSIIQTSWGLVVRYLYNHQLDLVSCPEEAEQLEMIKPESVIDDTTNE